MSSNYRYGFYLRPDWAMSRAISETHRLLRAKHNLVTAGLFMPHATVKEIFRTDATPEILIERLDQHMAGWQACTAYNNGLTGFGPRSIVVGLKRLPDGTPNHALYALQERAWKAIEPLLHLECEFKAYDPRELDTPNPFHPHLALAMADLKPEFQAEVLAFIQQGGPVGPPQFPVNICQLFRFEADWKHGWYHTLSWELLHSWPATA